MTTTLRVNIQDLNLQFIKDLQEQAGSAAQVEIKVDSPQHGEGLFSEAQFWELIDLFDWSQQKRAAVTLPAVQALSKMPVSSIYLFADVLSEKLFAIDTKAHAAAYLQQQTDDYFSMDDFLYVRCGVVAEGKAYYENILQHPSELSAAIDFEPLLYVSAEAYQLKTGRAFEYTPLFSIESKSNVDKWK